MSFGTDIDDGKYKNTLPFATKSERVEYREQELRIKERFKHDLFLEFDVEHNPRREKCFTSAWERGHSGGYREVYNEFIDLVDLIK